MENKDYWHLRTKLIEELKPNLRLREIAALKIHQIRLNQKKILVFGKYEREVEINDNTVDLIKEYISIAKSYQSSDYLIQPKTFFNKNINIKVLGESTTTKVAIFDLIKMIENNHLKCCRYIIVYDIISLFIRINLCQELIR